MKNDTWPKNNKEDKYKFHNDVSLLFVCVWTRDVTVGLV